MIFVSEEELMFILNIADYKKAKPSLKNLASLDLKFRDKTSSGVLSIQGHILTFI